MAEIKVERNPPRARLDELRVTDWDIWTCEVSRFPWTYAQEETCYFLDGDVVVSVEGRELLRIGRGDLVTFPKGLKCAWDVRRPVRKHFHFWEEEESGAA